MSLIIFINNDSFLKSYLKEYARGLEFSVKPDYLTIKNSFMQQYIELGFAAEDIDKFDWGTLPVSID